MDENGAIGFDFGTTNSAIAVLLAGETEPRLIPLDVAQPESPLVPTALYFRPDGMVHIGRDAIETYVRLEADHTIRRERRATGAEIETVYGTERVLTDVDVNQPGRFFQSIKRSLADSSFRGTEIFGRAVTLEDLVATFASEMRKRAEVLLGRDVTRAVVGRPVHWSKRDAGDALALSRMESALRQAGFSDFEFMEEPIAAGLRLASTLPEARTVLVFDFGGGTLDVTIMRIGGAERDVLATAGIPIGGDVLDEDIMDRRLLGYFGEQLRWGPQLLPMPQHILDTARRWYTIPELNEPATVRFLHDLERERKPTVRRPVRALLSLARGNHGWSLFQEIERAKIGLSEREQERVHYVADAIAIDDALSRTEFEGLIEQRVRQSAQCIDEALSSAGLTTSQIDLVMHTGGSSLIPRFRRMLANTFGSDKLTGQDAFTSVASGLAIAAAGRSRNSVRR